MTVTDGKTDSQGDYIFPKDETVRDLASTARGDSPDLEDDGPDGPVSPSLHAAPARSADPPSPLEHKSRQPEEEAEEAEAEEEEDSLVIIDKDLDDDAGSTRSSAGEVLDQTELGSVSELPRAANH